MTKPKLSLAGLCLLLCVVFPITPRVFKSVIVLPALPSAGTLDPINHVRFRTLCWSMSHLSHLSDKFVPCAPFFIIYGFFGHCVSSIIFTPVFDYFLRAYNQNNARQSKVVLCASVSGLECCKESIMRTRLAPYLLHMVPCYARCVSVHDA